MPLSGRNIRVGEQIKRILATIISNEIKGLNLISIVDVKLSSDLQNAKVFVTSLDNNQQSRCNMIEILNESAGFLRHKLSKKLSLRRVPNLVFIYDKTLEHANDIEQLINKLKTH